MVHYGIYWAVSSWVIMVYVTRSGKMRRKSRFSVLELLSDPASPQNYL